MKKIKVDLGSRHRSGDNQDIIGIIIRWQREIIPDGADQETIAGRSTGGEIKRDQRVKGEDSAHRGEQRYLLVSNSYI